MKTNFVMFAPKQTLGCDAIDSLQINGQTIHRVNSTKFLVYIDDELDWGLQISHIRKKIASGSYAINSAKRCLSVDNLRTLFYSFFHSHLSYANIIWCSTFQSKLRTLEVAQKRAIRNVCGVSYNEHSSPLLKKLGVPQLKDLHKIQLCRLMYNFTHDILPRSSLSDLFITNANVHAHNTRQRDDPHISRKTSFHSRTFVHQGPKLWMDLPTDIKQAVTLKSFTHHVKNHFINSY